MSKRGGSWLCAAELTTRVGVPRTRHRLACPHVSDKCRDNVRCINDIYKAGEHVVQVDNMRRVVRIAFEIFSKVTAMTGLGDLLRAVSSVDQDLLDKLQLSLESAHDHLLTGHATHVWMTLAKRMTFW